MRQNKRCPCGMRDGNPFYGPDPNSSVRAENKSKFQLLIIAGNTSEPSILKSHLTYFSPSCY